MAQREDQAIVPVESIEGPVQLADGQGVVKRSGWGGMVHAELDEAMLALRKSECGANDLATKPGGEGIRISEGIQAQPSREQCLLDRIGARVSRAGHEPRRPERSRQVRADELAVCLPITGAGRRDEGGRSGVRAQLHPVHTY